MRGLTPGSVHEVDVIRGGCADAAMTRGTLLDDVQADDGGRLQASFESGPRQPTRMRSLIIRLANPRTADGGINQVAEQAVACALMPGNLDHLTMLRLVPQSSSAMPLGGIALVHYDAEARTLTVTVRAHGFVAGTAHAAHIHLGSCGIQGQVAYMLPDLVADSNGDIASTATITGVRSAPPALAGTSTSIRETATASWWTESPRSASARCSAAISVSELSRR
jgi:hypothetical protein